MTTKRTAGVAEMTEEPWEHETPNGHLVIGRTGRLVADCTRPEDARRIVACVNACEGISTENMEENKPIIELARAYNVSLRQRDDLLEALQWYEAKAVQMGRAAIHQDSKLMLALMKEIAVEYGAKARAAIARATGERP